MSCNRLRFRALLGLGIGLLVVAALPTVAAERWFPGPDMSTGRGYFGLVFVPSGDLLAPGGVILMPCSPGGEAR